MNSSVENMNADQIVAQKPRPTITIEAPSDPAEMNICIGCE